MKTLTHIQTETRESLMKIAIQRQYPETMDALCDLVDAHVAIAYQLGKDASVEYIHNHLMTNDWHTTDWKALLDQARSV